MSYDGKSKDTTECHIVDNVHDCDIRITIYLLVYIPHECHLFKRFICSLIFSSARFAAALFGREFADWWLHGLIFSFCPTFSSSGYSFAIARLATPEFVRTVADRVRLSFPLWRVSTMPIFQFTRGLSLLCMSTTSP